VRAVVAWGDAHLSTRCMVALIHPENVASLRVAEKFGFRELCRSRYHDEPTVQLVRELPSQRGSGSILQGLKPI